MGVEKCFCDKNITKYAYPLVSQMCVQSIQSQSEIGAECILRAKKHSTFNLSVNEDLGPPFREGNKPYGAA